jgi:hypothetical protein
MLRPCTAEIHILRYTDSPTALLASIVTRSVSKVGSPRSRFGLRSRVSPVRRSGQPRQIFASLTLRVTIAGLAAGEFASLLHTPHRCKNLGQDIILIAAAEAKHGAKTWPGSLFQDRETDAV